MTSERRSDFKDLIVWQCALDLTVVVYELARRLPRTEMYALSAQLRRAAVSVPSNIAEGSARRTTREFIAFLHIARGSLAEIETQLELTERFGYLHGTELQPSRDLVARVGQLLNAMLRGLRKRMGDRAETTV
jgi:four helix bundle protein